MFYRARLVNLDRREARQTRVNKYVSFSFVSSLVANQSIEYRQSCDTEGAENCPVTWFMYLRKPIDCNALHT